MALDMTRLARLMRMTESNHDGEALNALRLANKMLKEANVNWEDVLTGGASASSAKSHGAPDYRTPPSRRGASSYGSAAPRRDQKRNEERVSSNDIADMLSDVGDRRFEVSTLMFVASLREFWERSGYLTRPQYEALIRIHRETGERERSGGGRWRF